MAVGVPDWHIILEQAREWGVPPWVVEAECPPLWDIRWRADRNATAKGAKDKAAHG